MTPLHALEVFNQLILCGPIATNFAYASALFAWLCAANGSAPRQIGTPHCCALSAELILCNGAAIANDALRSPAGESDYRSRASVCGRLPGIGSLTRNQAT